MIFNINFAREKSFGDLKGFKTKVLLTDHGKLYKLNLDHLFVKKEIFQIGTNGNTLVDKLSYVNPNEFLYSSRNQIYQYDIRSGFSEVLYQGEFPEYLQSSKSMTFFRQETDGYSLYQADYPSGGEPLLIDKEIAWSNLLTVVQIDNYRLVYVNKETRLIIYDFTTHSRQKTDFIGIIPLDYFSSSKSLLTVNKFTRELEMINLDTKSRSRVILPQGFKVYNAKLIDTNRILISEEGGMFSRLIIYIIDKAKIIELTHGYLDSLFFIHFNHLDYADKLRDEEERLKRTKRVNVENKY